jgi:hypothetical protein
MPYHRLTFRTDTPTWVTGSSKVRAALQFVTEPAPAREQGCRTERLALYTGRLA